MFAEILNSDGDGGLRALLARHEDEASEVAVFDWGCLVDMDRRDDYRLLAAALAGHRMPDVAECETMFDAAATPEATRRHGRAVAALATSLARRLQAAGEAIDPDLARAAALVHDIAKGRRRHAEAGAALLREFGFPELAAPVARHMNLAFDAGRLDESAVVYLADKLVQGETRVSLETRFAPALDRFAGDPSALAGVRRRLASARAICAAVEARIGSLAIDDDAAIAAAGEWSLMACRGRRLSLGFIDAPARPASRRLLRSVSPKATSSIGARPVWTTARSSRRSGAESIGDALRLRIGAETARRLRRPRRRGRAAGSGGPRLGPGEARRRALPLGRSA